MPRRKNDMFGRWDTLILRLTICCLVLLALSQAALLTETPRRYLSQVDRLEGETVSWQTPLVAAVPPTAPQSAPAAYSLDRLRPGREVILRLVRPPADPDIFVLVNGKRQGDFAAGEVNLAVYDGDYLEVDASRRPTPVRFVVRLPDGGLDSPLDGTVLEGAGGIIAVGKVKVKH